MNLYIKGLIYLAIFSILHFGYDLTEWKLLAPFCGINESVFQHLKMAFWAYILASIVERFSKGRFNGTVVFWYPKLLSAVMLPWITMILWYIVPAVYGKIEVLWVEVAWSILITYIAVIAVMVIERGIEAGKIDFSFKVVTFILFVVSVFLYVSFTYKLPWIDVFIDPKKV
ncbi:MAG: hypothetical protein H5T91_10525 [Synergistetes bacterium]|nr:MAG: Uncharacterized protein XD52_1570 [bacterium 42_11]MBC7332838.1 hypothetical protein [Synergistota bacterium]MDK2871761.1 hypothetical protein [bacterium]